MQAQSIAERRQQLFFIGDRDFREHVSELVSDLLEMYLYYQNWVGSVGFLRNSLLEWPYVSIATSIKVAKAWTTLYVLLPQLSERLIGLDTPINVGSLPTRSRRMWIRCRASVVYLHNVSRQAHDAFMRDMDETASMLWGSEEEAP